MVELRRVLPVVDTGADRVQAQVEQISQLSNRRSELEDELTKARQHLEMITEELERLPQDAGGEPAAELRQNVAALVEVVRLLVEAQRARRRQSAHTSSGRIRNNSTAGIAPPANAITFTLY